MTETRKCSHCGSRMTEGYLIEGGCEYYCSKRCLNKKYTDEEFNTLYAKGEGESYWTSWE